MPERSGEALRAFADVHNVTKKKPVLFQHVKDLEVSPVDPTHTISIIFLSVAPEYTGVHNLYTHTRHRLYYYGYHTVC